MEGTREKCLLEYAMMRKTNPPPFLLKTYMLIDDPATDSVISWNDGGTAFVVWQPVEFAKDLLPKLFKHSNFSSFVRQLNTYGFRKVATGRWEFCNETFQRGKKELLCHIRRRKASSHRHQQLSPATTRTLSGERKHDDDPDQRSSSTSSSSELNSLVDENKRLKEENGVLNCELITMKRKCKELLDLVAFYTTQREGKQTKGEKETDGDVEQLRPKLFGVRLEVQGERERKRTRLSTEVYENVRRLLSQSCK